MNITKMLKEKWAIKEEDRTCCSKCGHDASKKWNYCSYCGSRLSSSKYPNFEKDDNAPQSEQ